MADVDDVVLDRFWLPHAVMASPHAATAKTPRVAVLLRAAAPVGQWQPASCMSRIIRFLSFDIAIPFRAKEEIPAPMAGNPRVSDQNLPMNDLFPVGTSNPEQLTPSRGEAASSNRT